MPIDRTPDQGEVMHQPDPPPFPKQPGSDEERAAARESHRPGDGAAKEPHDPDAQEIARRPGLPTGVPHMPADDGKSR